MNTKFLNVADLVDSRDARGRTYRQINNEMKHTIPVGTLVEELETGVRLFVAKQTRDCDGTPLYSLSAYSGEEEREHHPIYHGYPQHSLVVVAGRMIDYIGEG